MNNIDTDCTNDNININDKVDDSFVINKTNILLPNYCELCNKSFKYPLRYHYQSALHQNKLKPDEIPINRCNICRINLLHTSIEKHNLTKSHIDKAGAHERKLNPLLVMCEICNTSFNKDYMHIHLISKKHNKKQLQNK